MITDKGIRIDRVGGSSPASSSGRAHQALLALTAAALAIPATNAHAQAVGDVPTSSGDSTLLDYRYAGYREGDIPGSKTASGQRSQRYDVDSHQFRAATRLGAASDLTADITVETMSGASPWFIIPDAKGKPLQVMSGASIHDFRQSLQLRADQHFDDLSGSLLAGYSSERDYRTSNAGLEGSWDFNGGLSTLSGGGGYTRNILDPTEGQSARFPTRIAHAHNDEGNGFIGVSQVLTQYTVLQTSLSGGIQHGDLSDPYKLVYVDGNTRNDTRPGNRRLLAWTTRLRQDIPKLHAALHIDYRFYSDNWGVNAHTAELAWYQSLPYRWVVVPRLRWYSQSQADFYQPYYSSLQSTGLYSCDYRLSPFGALSESFGIYKRLGGWSLSVRYEHYDSSGSFALKHVEVENPGLVKFQVFSAGIAKAF